MGIFLKLAIDATLLGTEVAEAEGGGWGFNFNIFEANLVNLLIVYAILIYFGRGFLGKTLSDRKTAIKTAIDLAEQRKKEAAAALAAEQQKLAQAQSEVARIRTSAAEAAQAASASILAKAEQDIQRMRQAAAQDLNTEQERVLSELRQRVAALALQRVESELPSRLNDDVQRRLTDRSIALFGGS
jgi:F-type H+-transporting ATPase subunit b